MKDYKTTLNLPVTDFPMKADLAQREPKILARWEQIGLYQKLQEQNKNKKRYVLHDGPPYANSVIHLGTALNKTLKDIVVKSKILSGYHAPFVPGWDCHGLPIELVVEKKTGKPGTKLTHKEFRHACREYAKTQVEIQKADFIRLGVLGDWQHPYLTLNYTYEADTIRALAKMVEKGYVYRGYKPVYWCLDCGSSLAEAEVEYKDKTSPAIDVAFEVQDREKLFTAFGVKPIQDTAYFPIWTTTPWTLPANQAVAIHENLEYVLVHVEFNQQKQYWVIANDLLTSVMERYGVTHYKHSGQVRGKKLEGITLKHPFIDRLVPVVLGEHVTTEAGTGNVHTAPIHGPDDFVIGEKYHLSLTSPLDERNCFQANIPLVSGVHVFKANDPIIVGLADSGHLLHQAVYKHSYPHCWRHKTPLMFRATPQWFVSLQHNDLRGAAAKAIEKVKWIPNWGETRIGKMIEGRPDWCISRQRTWGIPIAIFIHKETFQMHPNTGQLMQQAADLVEKNGIDAWYDLDPKELLGNDADHYIKVTDILDVWFDSGVTHYCVLRKNPQLQFPADLYLEGSDQHRGWFQSSLLSALPIEGRAPYKTVLTHGYVVDGKGYKMSKSIGNMIAPSEVINKMGADILRLWVAATNFTNDISYSDEIIKHIAEAYRRIRNTVRFLLSNLYDFDPEKNQVPPDQLLALDRYALELTQQIQQKIITAYDEFAFTEIYQLIHNFCSIELGSFYLDIIKDRLYTSAKTQLPRRSAQTALYHILESLVRWLAPILSFTAEEIWQFKPGKKQDSVFLSAWYENYPKFKTQEKKIDWQQVTQVRNAVNKILEQHRNQGEIGSALEAEVTLYGNETMMEFLKNIGAEWRYLLITSDVHIKHLQENGSEGELTDIPGLRVKVVVSSNKKCIRCWQRRQDVGVDKNDPEICLRCVDSIHDRAEKRVVA